MRYPPVIVALGDSITIGTATYLPYPWALQQLLGYRHAVANMGHGGDTAASIVTRWSTNVRTATDVFKSAGCPERNLILLGGINSIVADVSAASIFADLKSIIDNAVLDNSTLGGAGNLAWKRIFWVTPTPFGDYSVGSGWTTARQAVMTTLLASINAYVAANVFIVDAYTGLANGEVGTSGSPRIAHSPDYYTGSIGGEGSDGLHPNNLGQLKIAQLIQALWV